MIRYQNLEGTMKGEADADEVGLGDLGGLGGHLRES